MTLDEAVAVLNERRHNGFDRWIAMEWTVLERFGTTDTAVWGETPFEREASTEFLLTPFEAIAVAEKYVLLEIEADIIGHELTECR